jgi:hypothetical protein
MNKTLKLALSAVLGLAVLTPALAQQFPDVVPPEHWAYDAVLRLKDAGILVGYPDGRFRGARNATRYEMAVAINAAYQNLKALADAHEQRIAKLESMAGGNTDDLRKAIEALQNDVAMMKRWRSEIDDLQRMSKEFEKNIAGLGVDVAAMRKDLTDIQERVGILEKRKPAVDIHGDVNFLALGGASQSGDFGVTVDGRPTGFGKGSYFGTPVGMDRDLSVFHEMAMSFTGTNEEGPKWGATLVHGNMLNAPGFFNQSEVVPGIYFAEGDSDTWIQDAWINFDTSLAGLGFNATVGRFGVMVSPYIFARPDNTPYFVNERWDNNQWTIDGARLAFNFGAAKFAIFGGRTSYNKSTVQSFDFQPMFAGQSGISYTPGGFRPIGFSSGGLLLIDRALGATLNVPVTQNGSLNLAYMWLSSDGVGTTVFGDDANGVNVWGGDLRFNFGGPTLEAGYSQSDVVYNSSRVVSSDNAAWYARLGWNQGKWGLNLGYRNIDPQFAAPGWWGRIGMWWNPTDIKGFMGDAHFDLTDMLRLTASAEFYTGTDTTINAVTGLTEDDKIRRFLIGVAYKINNSWDFGLGWENVEWDLNGAPDNPTERWYNIGFGYTLNNSVGIKFLWQISDYNGRGVAGFGLPGFFGGSDRARGSLATAQVTVKY